VTVAREPAPSKPALPAPAPALDGGVDRPTRPATEAEADRPPAAALDARAVRSLQGAAGNAAVSRLMVQRLHGPDSDPKFAALRRDVRGKQQRLTAHKPPAAEAGAARAASKAPADEALSQAKVAQSGDMAAAKPGGFDKAAFVKAVNAAIAAQAPKNYAEAEKVGSSNTVKDQISGQVSTGKQQSAEAITTATGAPPDQSRAKVVPDTPLTADQPPGRPAPPDPANAVPDKAPPPATDLSRGPKQVDQLMVQENVTPEQLEKSNEDSFHAAAKAKKEGEQHAATAPGEVRAQETAVLGAAKQHAAGEAATSLATMSGARARDGTTLDAGKHTAKDADQAARAEVNGKLQKVFDTCKSEVEQILSGLDKKVDDQFTREEKAAHDAFTADYTRRIEAYKDERYSGWTGKARWLKDKFTGLPSEVNAFYDQSRTVYTSRMQAVISSVADLIGAELGRAKQRIATGRAELQAAIAQLPKDQQAIGREAAGRFTAQFEELTATVDAKGEELVQTLATKYTEALTAVNDEIEKEKEKNRGLIAKAMDAVGGVIKTILELKNLLMGVLAKAASAVMSILKDPIAFLGHLVSAVGAGLHAFLSNIGAHLNKGLVGWLLGAMTGAGLMLPGKFDLAGILLMVASLLGLSWSFIRGRITAKGIPDQAVTAAEKAVPMVGQLKSEGVGGITKTIAGRVGDLKANLFSKITAYLIPTVIVAGITWIVSLLNPASAFIKACKMIADIVMFIVERGAQIVAFVTAVLDAVIAIAAGGAGGVPGLIETALAASIPVLIGVLAAILGIGGIAEKVKKFFQSLSKPVMKAVDWIVGKITGLAKKLWAKLKSKFGGGKKDGKPDERTAAEKERAVRSAAAEVEALAGEHPERKQLQSKLPGIQARYGLTRIYFEDQPGGEFHVVAEINPRWPTKNYQAGETKYTVTVDGERMLRPNYQGAQMIRRRLYSSSNRDATQRIIRDRVTPLARQQNPDTGQWEKAPDFNTAKYWEPSPGQIVSMTDQRTKPTLQHSPSVVSHWNTIGNDTDQSTRIAFYHFRGREDQAEVLMFYLNRDESGEGEYTPKVTANFKEPGE
jgi:hypothetical protein